MKKSSDNNNNHGEEVEEKIFSFNTFHGKSEAKFRLKQSVIFCLLFWFHENYFYLLESSLSVRGKWGRRWKSSDGNLMYFWWIGNCTLVNIVQSLAFIFSEIFFLLPIFLMIGNSFTSGFHYEPLSWFIQWTSWTMFNI